MGVRLDDLANSTTPTLATVPTQISTADAQNMGTSAPIYYTEPKPPEPPIGERVGEDIEKPFIQLQHTVGAGMSFLGDNLKAATPFGDLGSRITRAGILMQERSISSMQKKFSNFTPNMLDDLIGSVPTIAGFFGLAAASTAAIATGTLATTVGLGIGAEEFNKMKAKGHGTGMSDLAGSLEGIAGGAVMALGFNKVSEFVEPWLTNVLGATVAKMVGVRTALLAARATGNAAAGAVGMGAQATTTDTGEMITGVEKADAVKVMTDTLHSGIMGAVLGGGLGTTFALHQMAKFQKGLMDLGFSPKEAHQNSVMVFGQGAHVLMDAVEKNLKYKADELARVQSPAAKGEVSPNILERSGIPEDQNFPAAEKEAEPNAEVEAMSKNNKYVRLEPLNIETKATDKLTGEEVVRKYVGGRDVQRLRNSHMYEDWTKLIDEEKTPESSDLKQQAVFRSDATPEFLKLAFDNPRAGSEQLHQNLKELFGSKIDPKESDIKATEEWLKSMRPVIQLALNPTPAMKQLMAEGKIYYDEQGAVSEAMGTVKDIRKNYHSSRLYKPGSVANSMRELGSTTKKWSAHSLERVYPNSWMASADGMEFRTENFSDAAYAHAHEMTEVNYSRQVQNALVEKKPMPLAAWISPFTAPPGWKTLDEVTKIDFPKDKNGNFKLDENGNPVYHEKVFAGPAGLIDAMRPIVEPNNLERVWGYKTFTKIQDAGKTGLLSLSLFHDKNLGIQVLSSVKGFETLANLPKVLKDDLMSTPTFRDLEKLGVKYGMTSQATHKIQDVWLGMNKGDDAFSKTLQAPIVKQVVDAVDAHSELLFNGEQRYYKTMTFGNLFNEWMQKHPNATSAEIDAAGYGFGAHVNSVFGGLNWEMLGWTRTQVAIARAVMLAPDWAVSGILTGKYAFTEGFNSAKGNAARVQLAKAIIGGIVAANIINFIRTGHSTFENKKGHWFDADIEPDVYVSMITGGAGEILKLGSDLFEEEGAQGFARYSEGKLATLPSAGVRFFSGVTYSGGQVWRGHSALEKNINGFWNVLGPALGIPIGISSGADYLMREPQKSVSGFSLTSMGLARFSKKGR